MDQRATDRGTGQDSRTVPLSRRAAAGILDVGGAAATCFVLLDLALSLRGPWPLAWLLALTGPTLLWGLLESRGPGAIGRFAAGLATRNLDTSRLTYRQALQRQAPLGLLVSTSVLIAPGLALIALALGSVDLASGRGQPLHRTLRDRWSGSVVVSRDTAAASERIAGYAYLESGAPMHYRGEG